MTARSSTLLLLAVLAAGAVFVVRGPVRFAARGGDRIDFTGPYLGARAWVHGLDPYSPSAFWTEWEAAGLSVQQHVDSFESRTPYPLPALVLFAPIALLPWPTARIVAMGTATLLVLLAILALASIQSGGSDDRIRGVPSPRGLVFVALALLLTPLHTGINTGNPAAFAVALTALCAWAAVSGLSLLAGVALGAAMCLKPLVAAFALGYYVLNRRWRVAGMAIGLAAAATATGALRLRLVGAPWLADFLFNNSLLVGNRGSDVVNGSQSFRQFVHLEFLGQMLFGDAAAVKLLAVAVAGGLALVWLMLWARSSDERLELLELSALGIISLLPVYHRVYDAGLVLLPLCWAVSDVRPRVAWQRGATLILLVPFIIPAVTFIDMETRAGRIPAWLVDQWWWNILVVPQQVWALLLMALVLLSAQARSRRAVVVA